MRGFFCCSYLLNLHMSNFTENNKLKYEILEHFWGYSSFRDSQEEIISSVLIGKDTLALLPTGAGKSLCYQLPALMLEGTCIVISPLLALMKDQVIQLKKRGIEAEYLSSELDEFDAENIFSRCKEGITKILYVSPERLNNNLFLQNIEEINISFLAIDEAHCISEWGQDFRPSYQNIKTFRDRFKNLPCIALTATATPKVLQEIKTKLGLKSVDEFQRSFKRDNLSIIVEEISDKYQKVSDFLRYNNHSGIVYTRTRKETEELTKYLKSQNIQNVDYFHAGLPSREKNQKQDFWLKANNHVLIATNAFGMGIDKDNVRFVIHYSPSSSIENYYQEIGRAGRDGEESYAFLYFNQQELNNFDSILQNQIPNKKEFTTIISYIYSVFQIAENDLPDNTFQLQIDRVKKFTGSSAAKIRNVLNFLHNQEIIFHNDYKSLSTLQLKISPEDIDLLPKKDAYFLELLLRNLAGISTHKVYFSEQSLSTKIGTDVHLLKETIKELQKQNYLEYIDGSISSIKFLKHRDSRLFDGKYWSLFQQIQKNKIQKWEEMKYYISENQFCKMKMILAYFGEKNIKNCGKCYICKRNKDTVFGSGIMDDILTVLQKKPSTIEEIAVQLQFHRKEKILENIINLLDAGKVKMLNFRTYTLA